MCCDADSSRWQPVLYQLFVEIGVDVRTMYIVHTLHYIEDWGGMCDHVLMMLGVADLALDQCQLDQTSSSAYNKPSWMDVAPWYCTWDWIGMDCMVSQSSTIGYSQNSMSTPAHYIDHCQKQNYHLVLSPCVTFAVKYYNGVKTLFL